MDALMTARFFGWCTIVNGGLLILWVLLSRTSPDLLYRTQKGWCPLTRPQFDNVFYCFLGLFKLMFLIFNLAPYIALRIVTS